MELNNRLANLPVGYICSEVESRFPNSVSFERKGAAVCFIETASLTGKSGDRRETLKAAMEEFTETMGVRIGASDAFRDVYSARLYYHQASAALKNGTIIDPAKKYYHFQDYALTELIINSLGKMPTELFFSEGMRRLAAHDAEAPVSYIDTLRTYLDQKEVTTQRHTELRFERIGRSSGTGHDSGSDERLRIQILLKALQIQQINEQNRKRMSRNSGPVIFVPSYRRGLERGVSLQPAEMPPGGVQSCGRSGRQASSGDWF